MSKEMLKDLIDLLDEKDTNTVFRFLIQFIPEDKPLQDEIDAIKRANESIEKYGTIPHEAINWD